MACVRGVVVLYVVYGRCLLRALETLPPTHDGRDLYRKFTLLRGDRLRPTALPVAEPRCRQFCLWISACDCCVGSSRFLVLACAFDGDSMACAYQVYSSSRRHTCAPGGGPESLPVGRIVRERSRVLRFSACSVGLV